MASKTASLTADNLKTLGVDALAELLMEFSTGDAAMKRRLRMELAASHSGAELAKEVRKRLTAIAKATSFVDRHRTVALAKDLDTQRRAIGSISAQGDPIEALDLMWRFMDLTDCTFERCNDTKGVVIDVFAAACKDLGALAERAKIDPELLADRAINALINNHYGQFDGLTSVLAPALGQTGLEHLKQGLIDFGNSYAASLAEGSQGTCQWLASGPDWTDRITLSPRIRAIRSVLIEIADAQGDADGFAALFDETARKLPSIAAAISRRLLIAGRAEEALRFVDAAEPRHPDIQNLRFHCWESDNARVDVLEALGRPDEAQAMRWSIFEGTLSETHLRAYLKRLPDFDDIEAEEKALDHASGFLLWFSALQFLVSWPALDRAAALVFENVGELDGEHYEELNPIADALAARHPLAATLILRAMIDFTLDGVRSQRYKHAARDLLQCASLAPEISDFGVFETHDEYFARLRRDYVYNYSFWPMLDGAGRGRRRR